MGTPLRPSLREGLRFCWQAPCSCAFVREERQYLVQREKADRAVLDGDEGCYHLERLAGDVWRRFEGFPGNRDDVGDGVDEQAKQSFFDPNDYEQASRGGVAWRKIEPHPQVYDRNYRSPQIDDPEHVRGRTWNRRCGGTEPNFLHRGGVDAEFLFSEREHDELSRGGTRSGFLLRETKHRRAVLTVTI